MIRLVCQSNEIELNVYLAESIPAFFFLTFFFQGSSFYLSYFVKKTSIKRIKYVQFIYFLLLLIFAIISFIIAGQMDESKKKTVWDSLSTLSKDYYNNNIGTLVV